MKHTLPQLLMGACAIIVALICLMAVVPDAANATPTIESTSISVDPETGLPLLVAGLSLDEDILVDDPINLACYKACMDYCLAAGENWSRCQRRCSRDCR